MCAWKILHNIHVPSLLPTRSKRLLPGAPRVLMWLFLSCEGCFVTTAVQICALKHLMSETLSFQVSLYENKGIINTLNTPQKLLVNYGVIMHINKQERTYVLLHAWTALLGVLRSYCCTSHYYFLLYLCSWARGNLRRRSIQLKLLKIYVSTSECLKYNAINVTQILSELWQRNSA